MLLSDLPPTEHLLSASRPDASKTPKQSDSPCRPASSLAHRHRRTIQRLAALLVAPLVHPIPTISRGRCPRSGNVPHDASMRAHRLLCGAPPLRALEYEERFSVSRRLQFRASQRHSLPWPFGRILATAGA
ncbi:hypothetical protein V8C37DRAFT_379705 [Trichoderma ceciliae]